MTVTLEEMLVKIKRGQWALADIDWDAPGANIRPDQFDGLKSFMADLVWIENIGARGFAALAKKTDDPVLAEIYRYFHAEEQRHANAELALMRRWGMLSDDEIPEPNVNVKLGIKWLDSCADSASLSVLGTIIPMLEVALDGALVKFLLDEVDDPVCHEVFRRINSDESRHLAVDFQVLDMLGAAPLRKLLVQAGGSLHPKVLIGIGMYIPLLNKMRDNIIGMGLPEEKLYAAMNRFAEIGGRSSGTKRLPMFHVFSTHAKWVVDRGHPYHLLADSMVKVTGFIPGPLQPKIPSWAKELTYEPVNAA
ncbi:MAG TPA: hypothetical protein VNC22_13840 [Sporichthya sp.]|nr:hypothetical protein [Sporichthya sp.]